MQASWCRYSPLVLLLLLRLAAPRRSAVRDQPLLHAYDLVPPLVAPPPLVSIPVYVDTTEAEFNLFEGDELDARTLAFARRLGFGAIESQVEFLRQSCRARLGARGLGSSALRVAVVVAYEDDAVDTVRNPVSSDTSISGSTSDSSSDDDDDDDDDTDDGGPVEVDLPVLWRLVAQALAHGHHNEGDGGRVHLVLVTNGFGLSGDARASLAAACARDHRNTTDRSNEGSNNSTDSPQSAGGMIRPSCGSVAVVELSEVIGFGAAVNLALEHLHAPGHGLLRAFDFDGNDGGGGGISEGVGGGGRGGGKKAHTGEVRAALRAAIVAVITAASPLRAGLAPGCGGAGGHRPSAAPVLASDNLGPPAAEGCDVWQAYASLARARGGASEALPPLIFAAPSSPRPRVEVVRVTEAAAATPAGASSAASADAASAAWALGPCVACAAPLPLLVFDAALWRTSSNVYNHSNVGNMNSDCTSSNCNSDTSSDVTEGLGPLDEGFWLQGAAGEWAFRAHRRGLLVDASSKEISGAASSNAFAFEARFMSPLPVRRRTLVVAYAAEEMTSDDHSSRAEGRGSSSSGMAQRLAFVVGPSLAPGSAVVAAEALAALDVDHLLVHLQEEHCQALPPHSSRHPSARGVGRNGARCHYETVGASLLELQRRADDEERADARESDANTHAAKRKNGMAPNAAAEAVAVRSWRSLLEAFEWQWQWMGRSPSAVSAAGWSDQLRVGAVVVLYDDALGLVANLLPDLLASVHHTVVLVSAEPWHGTPRDVQPTLALLARFLAQPRFATRLSVVSGLWASEEAQRAFGNAFLRALPVPAAAGSPSGFTHVLVVDGDEFWHPAELHRSLCLVANVARHAYNAVRRGVTGSKASRGQNQGQRQAEASVAAAEVDQAAAAAAVAAVPFARASMATYWRTVRGVVDPPEALRILWLVSLELCDWTKDREIECALPAATASALRWLQDQGGGGTNHANGSDVVFDGLMLDPSAGVCHHLSYVRTTSQLVYQKLASFAHAQDVLDAAEKRYSSTSSRNSGGTGSSSSSASTNGLARWISETWHKWEEEHSLRNLHPTHPPAYDHVLAQPLHVLPPALRKLHLRIRRDDNFITTDDEEEITMFSLIPKTEGASFQWRIANVSPSPLDLISALSSFRDSWRKTLITTDASGKSLDWKSTSDLDVEEVSLETPNSQWVNLLPGLDASTSVDISPSEFFNETATSLCQMGWTSGAASGDGPRVLILVVHEGELDSVTGDVFDDVVQVVAHGLKQLGALVAIKSCFDLRLCQHFSFPERTFFTILLGAHHLARYTRPDLGDPRLSPFVLWESFSLFQPSNSVLYNFEHAAGQNDLKESPEFASVLERWEASGNLWDYSEGNVFELSRRGFRAQYAPLGYAPALEDFFVEVSPAMDIDVLFYGMLNDYRRGVLRELRRDHGFSVLHANANGPVFGARLLSLIRRAKVVLSLRYWANDADEGGEWKMTRFLRPLASGTAVVVSERCGSKNEQDTWGGEAVVFANSTRGLAAVLRHFLDHPNARVAQALRARATFRRARAEDSLRVPIRRLVQGACPKASWPER